MTSFPNTVFWFFMQVHKTTHFSCLATKEYPYTRSKHDLSYATLHPHKIDNNRAPLGMQRCEGKSRIKVEGQAPMLRQW